VQIGKKNHDGTKHCCRAIERYFDEHGAQPFASCMGDVLSKLEGRRFYAKDRQTGSIRLATKKEIMKFIHKWYDYYYDIKVALLSSSSSSESSISDDDNSCSFEEKSKPTSHATKSATTTTQSSTERSKTSHNDIDCEQAINRKRTATVVPIVASSNALRLTTADRPTKR
jgi:PAB1-binding protein PBP1